MDDKSGNKEKEELRIALHPDAPCGCGSGKQLSECHLKEKEIRVDHQYMWPPGPLSYQRIRKCYFSWTNNCGEGISGEHILSRAVLKHLDDKRILFTYRDTQRSLPLNSDALKVNKLCKRHNEGTTKIDAQAGRLIHAIESAHHILHNSHDGNETHFIFHGWDIERWLLKTLLNVHAAKLSMKSLLPLPPNIMEWFSEPLPAPFGFYIPTGGTNETQLEWKIQNTAAVYLLHNEKHVAGISVSLLGLEMKFLLPVAGVYELNFQQTHIHRPRFINFHDAKTKTVVPIMMAWQQPGHTDVWLTKDEISEY